MFLIHSHSNRSEDGNSIREAQALLYEHPLPVYRVVTNFLQTVFDTIRNLFPVLSPVIRRQSESALTSSDANVDPNVDSATDADENSNFTLPPEAFGKSLAAGVVYSFQLPVHLPKFFRDATPAAAPSVSVEAGKIGGSGTQKREATTKRNGPPKAVVAAPAPASLAPKLPLRRALHPRELLLIDTQGRVYLSAEIFGLGAMNESDSGEHNTNGPPIPSPSAGGKGPPFGDGAPVSASSAVVLPISGVNAIRVTPTAATTTGSNGTIDNNTNDSNNVEAVEQREGGTVAATAAAPVVVSSLNAAQGGKYLHEECVVCLTDPKEVLLLPCRHLCVCYSCFAFVDKCPVCRAFFEEYLRIEINTKVSVGSVSPRQALL